MILPFETLELVKNRKMIRSY